MFNPAYPQVDGLSVFPKALGYVCFRDSFLIELQAMVIIVTFNMSMSVYMDCRISTETLRFPHITRERGAV